MVVLVPAFAVARRFGYSFRSSTLARYLLSNERRPLVAVALIALGTGALTSAVRPARPFVHDEFSYLLAGDTFAQGRLTNPTHPFWPHFETFHVLQQPSYQSKYPPAQGLFLAAGQLLSGRPLVGVWLSLALASAALYWCLSAWAPRSWAFFGALLPCIRFGSGLFWDHDSWAYWGASFWGGAVAFLGGCLALGAAPRLLRNPRLRDSLLLGLGFATLAASRPYEGLIVAVLISLLFLFNLARRGGWTSLARAMGPAAVVVGVSLCALSYYNWRVTGSPLRAPYVVYAQTYDVVPFLTFQELAPQPEYRHEILRQYHLGIMVGNFQAQKDGPGIDGGEIRFLVAFFLGPTLAFVTLLGLFWRSRWLVFVLLILLAAALSHAVTLSFVFLPHYLAPFAPALLLLTVRGLRVLNTWRFRGLSIGAPVAKAIVVVCLATFAGSVLVRAHTQPRIGLWNVL
ncbi:MAG: hypothetical protein ACYSWU_25790, partial [Planctomycetota bacterium]